MRNAIALAALLCLTTAASAAATGSTYRWVDKDGNVHYSDQVPMGSQAKLVKPDMVPQSSAPTEAEVAAAKARAEECKKVQAQLDSYNKAAKISETDSLGNVHEYSDDDRKKLIETTKAKVEEKCSAATEASANATAATP